MKTLKNIRVALKMHKNRNDKDNFRTDKTMHFDEVWTKSLRALLRCLNESLIDNGLVWQEASQEVK